MSRGRSHIELYNKFMKEEMRSIQAQRPDLNHREVFALVASHWNAYGRFHPPPPPSFPNPIVGDEPHCDFPATLLAELSIMAASNAIREKPDWWIKYKDPAIASRWRQEIMDASVQRGGGWVMREEQVDCVFKELDWYAEKCQKQIDSGVEAPIEMAIDCTRRSDGLIPSDLKERLLACVQKLKDVPDHLKDWHPGSNNQVLDIVHPSLYPVIAGRTLVTEDEAIPPLDHVGQGKVLEELPECDAPEAYCSKQYQWLSTDVKVTPEGQVKIKSYVNNLHPIEHKDIYPALEGILERFLPMFEEVLGEMLQYHSYGCRQFRLTTDYHHWDDDDDEGAGRTGSPLQVIFKLADIQLTADNPSYNGGVWHVEGMANENIVATGIYYYHSENITESRLNFRIQVCEPEYEQEDATGVEMMYGLKDEEPLVQSLDGIVTKQDRCIVFPNIFQHQVQPYSLEDPTKPGTRSILVFFLVNPEHPILSTTHVPPQQRDWAPNKGLLAVAAEELPPEVYELIEKLVDWPIDLDEAKAHREEFMKERKYFLETASKDTFERPFSLCEH
ncbi:unnamed protein product [Mortierella alpina]